MDYSSLNNVASNFIYEEILFALSQRLIDKGQQDI
jgi:hypothetical protein